MAHREPRLLAQGRGGSAGQLGERQQAQERPGSEGAEEHQHRSAEHSGDAATAAAEGRAPERRTATIANLARIRATSNSTARIAQIAARGPHHRGKDQRQHQHDDVDGGLPHQELEPQHERAGGRDQADRKARNGEPGRTLRAPLSSADLGEEMGARVPGRRGDDGDISSVAASRSIVSGAAIPTERSASGR